MLQQKTFLKISGCYQSSEKWYSEGRSRNYANFALASSDSSKVARVQLASTAFYEEYEDAYPIAFCYLPPQRRGSKAIAPMLSRMWDRQGTGHIDAYTGNLTFTVPVFATSSARTPMGLSFAYNGYEAGKFVSDKNGAAREALQNGFGWQISSNRRIEEVTNDALKDKFPPRHAGRGRNAALFQGNLYG